VNFVHPALSNQKSTKQTKSPKRFSAKAFKAWHKEREARYQQLVETCKSILDGLLSEAAIKPVYVTGRVKNLTSALEKAKRKNYQDLDAQFTDIAGLRVVLYRESDVEKVSKLISASFNVHPAHSVDKTKGLGADRFGYRSVHYICDLGTERCSLLEYAKHKGLLFELQIRTVLQHAWAEIEHDRSYKFGVKLPTPLRRRLHLVAGLLEMADRELEAISQDVDKYAEQIEIVKRGDYAAPITPGSVIGFVHNKARRLGVQIEAVYYSVESIEQGVIEELQKFGIKSVSDLSALFSEDFEATLKNDIAKTTWIGAVRDAMIYKSAFSYFAKSWDRTWQVIDDNMMPWLESRYGARRVSELMSEYNLMTENEAKEADSVDGEVDYGEDDEIPF
jgi:putative GTP pyrophosphokinase